MHMESIGNVSVIIALIVAVGGIIAAVVYFISVARNSSTAGKDETMSKAMAALKDTVTAVTQQNEILKCTQVAQAEEIADLKAKVNTLMNIPLQQLADYRVEVDGKLEAIAGDTGNILSLLNKKTS